jgi:hypothetical protein
MPEADERPLRVSTVGSRLYALFVNGVYLALPVGWSIVWLTRAPARPVAVVAGTIVAVVGGWVLWRVVTLSTVFKPEEIVVRNWYRTHRIRWVDVTGFVDSSVSTGEGANSKWALGIRQGDAETIKCQSTSWAGLDFRMAMLDEIHREAVAHGVPMRCADPSKR